MSVVGFDIGNNCYVGVARAGGIETVPNEYSDRCSPAIVGFTRLQRVVGTSAKNQMVTNYKSTVTQIKRLVGRKYDEPSMASEFAQLPYTCIRMDNGDIGIKVNYREEERIFNPEQVLAMLLTYLKQTAEDNLSSKVADVVIGVPAFYTDYQRRAVLSAAQITGLNCLKVMNETSAVALCYGLYKQDVPAADEKPRHVAFIDIGHFSYQICIAAFNKGKIKILATAWDDSLGGREFDNRLRDYFCKEILTKYRVDARTNKRAWIRLGAEVEKIKKQLGMNTTNLPLNIECFMEDKDVNASINRGQFEEMCADLIDRVEPPLQQALTESGLKVEEIDVVEIVGGSSRIPALRAIFEKVFHKPVSTTLNQDEAVVRGCAIQCAMLSHTVKVRDIEVLDAAAYPVHIAWDCYKNEDQYGEMEVFKKHHAYPFTKLLTFPHRVEPFCFRAYYDKDTPIPHIDRDIGEFVVNAVAPSETAEKVKVKVRVRLDMNGCFAVSSASMTETLPPSSPLENGGEVMETQEVNPPEKTNGEEKMDEAASSQDESVGDPMEQTEDPAKSTEEQKPEDAQTGAQPEPNKETTDKKKKPKKSTKTTDLRVDSKSFKSRTSEEMNVLIEIENELISQVKLEKERADAKNAVEEYVYGMREKIYDMYEKHITDDVRQQFSTLLTNTEDWLYEDGEDEAKSVYVDKLAELKKVGQPVVDRYHAHTELPPALEELGTALLHYRKVLDLYSQKDEKYDHLDAEEMKKVEKRVEDKFKWYNEKLQQKSNCPLHSNPPVLPSEVFSEKRLLEAFVNPIINKSKPKPKEEPPKDTPKDAPKDAPKEDATPAGDENKKPEGEVPVNGEQSPCPNKMDTEHNGPEVNAAPNVDLTMEVD
jgi:heat shock protein 4